MLCFIEHLCVTSVLKFILAVILVLIGESLTHTLHFQSKKKSNLLLLP